MVTGKGALIRSATAADIPAVMKLEQASETAAHWTRDQYELLFLRSRETSAARLALVVIEENADRESSGAHSAASDLSGFLVARDLGQEWELENIAISGAARRRGLASQLLAELLVRVRVGGSHTVFLEVRESNAPARAFYEKLVFHECGRRKDYYSNPREDAVIYKNSLG
jgi:ribosomal protein S18 acetylase RimI-like enzyme